MYWCPWESCMRTLLTSHGALWMGTYIFFLWTYLVPSRAWLRAVFSDLMCLPCRTTEMHDWDSCNLTLLRPDHVLMRTHFPNTLISLLLDWTLRFSHIKTSLADRLEGSQDRVHFTLPLSQIHFNTAVIFFPFALLACCSSIHLSHSPSSCFLCACIQSLFTLLDHGTDSHPWNDAIKDPAEAQSVTLTHAGPPQRGWGQHWVLGDR